MRNNSPLYREPKTAKAWIITLLFTVIGFCAHAQNFIGFSIGGFSGMPDTVVSGTQLPVAAYVKNYSSLNYFDTIQINGYVDTGSANVPFSFPPVDSVMLNAGDSVPFIMPFDFRDSAMGGIFRIGGNVIVVWPSLFNSAFNTMDSLTATVVVLDTITGIRPYEEFIDVKVYPVPAEGILFISASSGQYQVEQVIVTDMTGRVVCRNADSSRGIDTGSWPAGIYSLDVQFSNGARKIFKVVRR